MLVALKWQSLIIRQLRVDRRLLDCAHFIRIQQRCFDLRG